MQLVDHLAGDAEAGDEDAGAALDDGRDTVLDLAGQGREQVDAEGFRRRGLDAGDLLHELVVAHGRGAERADATGLRHRRHQTVLRHPAHAGQHHGVLDLQELGQSRPHAPHTRDARPARPSGESDGADAGGGSAAQRVRQRCADPSHRLLVEFSDPLGEQAWGMV